MRFLAPLIAGFLALPAHAQDFGPLAQLTGACYRADVPVEDGDDNANASDTHCFQWMLGNSLIKDEHSYQASADAPPIKGETVYAPKGGGSFTLTHYSDVGGIKTSEAGIENGTTILYMQEGNSRSRLALTDSGYMLTTEERKGGNWRETDTLIYSRVD